MRFGQIEALGVLFDRYAGVVMAVALRIVRDRAAAERIVERVFYGPWKNADTGTGDLAGPLSGRVLNKLVAHARKLAIQERDSSPSPVEVLPEVLLTTARDDDCAAANDLAENPNLRWQRERSRAALATIPDDARQVVEMLCLDAWNPEEIALRLNLDRKKVLALLVSGMRDFREALKPPPAARPFDKAHFPLVSLDSVRVLIVDDERDARLVLARTLQTLGAFVTTAAGVAEALQLVAQNKPQILVSDLAMPDEDGFDLIRVLRRTGRTARDLPAIALTAFATADVRRRALLAGYQTHIAKPANPNELAEVVASFTGRTGMA